MRTMKRVYYQSVTITHEQQQSFENSPSLVTFSTKFPSYMPIVINQDVKYGYFQI